MAARCPVVSRRSPPRKKVHVRSKRVGVQAALQDVPVIGGAGATCDVQRSPQISRASLSIPLPPESAELREALAKVAVLSLENGYVNESNLLAVMPSIINKD